jgi:transposase
MTGRGGRGNPYSDEFREQAVRLFNESGRPFKEVATQIGIADQTLRNWVMQAAIDAGQRPGLTSDEQAELKRLRREVKLVREENEFLKKASAFFAAEAKRSDQSKRSG